jgi:hypothetical protein
MKYKTGKLPAREDAIKFKFASYFDAKKLPVPPLVIGHELIGHPWGMLANDKYSDCVFAGAAHETMIWSHMGSGGKGVDFTDDNVLSDYAAVTGFDPLDPRTDQGTDMQLAAEYRRTTGIIDANGNRHKIDAYFDLRPGNPDDLALAIYLTGAVGIGIRSPDNIDKLFDARKPWSVTPGVRLEGGHYIPCMARNSKGLLVTSTWGSLQGMELSFYDKYCDEAVMYVSLESITQKGLSPDGLALDEIKRDLASLSS